MIFTHALCSIFATIYNTLPQHYLPLSIVNYDDIAERMINLQTLEEKWSHFDLKS